MSIDSEDDIKALQEIGSIVAATIKLMRESTVPGIKTRELDAIGAKFLASKGARSAPKVCYDFPGSTCICVNNEVAHGIPGSRRIRPGDLVNIDVSAEKNGFFADSGYSFVIPPIESKLQKLCDAGQGALQAAMNVARANAPLNSIGKAIETYAREHGYSLIRNLCSHGIGKALHEEPKEIPGFYDPSDTRVLTKGLVITIEPFISTGAWEVFESNDGWTLKTEKKYRTAQFEHTMIITESAPIVLTAC